MTRFQRRWDILGVALGQLSDLIGENEEAKAALSIFKIEPTRAWSSKGRIMKYLDADSSLLHKKPQDQCSKTLLRHQVTLCLVHLQPS